MKTTKSGFQYSENTAKIVSVIAQNVIAKVEAKYQKAKERLARYVKEGYLIDCGDHYKVTYIPFSTYRKKVERDLIDGVLSKDIAVDTLY